ncbi:hypothetical protein DQ237_15325 [Blastococcus sp. TF02-8]|uniref:hypothetical protein n=1 Tax=Blastococcus sp. TF02-8 TaxID=2250574 RepID=UPI000DEBE14F|nr:hypothetical protein [Blastococcus sp. TF02-8]RBY95085.1 hypothetical protein DQ237_15325 [Blastococcus sp. TF02-8]
MTLGEDWLGPTIREVASPLTQRMLRPLDRRCHTVQFSTQLTDADHRALAAWLSAYPSVTLRAYGAVPDLEFLRFYPDVQRFSADGLYDHLESFEGLGHLRPDLHTLVLGSTRRRLSLQPLARFTGLRRLYLEKQTRDLDVLAGLMSLTSLTLRSITLPDLSLLLPLTGLRALDLKLGGTRDLSLLPQVGKLEYLELWMVRGLDDLTPVAGTTTLRHLFLQALSRVTELPDLSRLAQLEVVHLETMTGITDLTPLLTAPSLREVSLVDMGHLQPADVGVLARHPRLRFLTAGLNSEKKNRAVRELVGLPGNENPTRPAFLDGDGDG